MSNDRLLSLAVLAAVLVTIGFNFFSDLLPVGWRSVGEISDAYPTRITPAGYAFSIWSIIYAGLLAFAIYQVLPAQRADARLRAIRPYVLVNCAANSVWLLVWRGEHIALSVPVMLVLLVTLIIIYTRLQERARGSSLLEKLCVELPFSLYFGWITVATIVNVAVALVAAGWEGGGIGAQTWAALLLLVALSIATVVNYNFAEPAYVLVFAWAFVAIAIAQKDAPLVRWTAVFAAAGAIAVLLSGLLRRKTAWQQAS